jgi:hypothetical protein
VRRSLPLLVAVLVAIPAAASATELGELLERGREAAYTAEQLITCSTPDGVRDALVRIEQSGAEIRIGSGVGSDTEVEVGAGGWALIQNGGVVEEATLAGSSSQVETVYVVEDEGTESFLGRDASVYHLVREGVLRAELAFDDETGVLVRVVSFDASGDAYCVRRFVSFDPTDPMLPAKTATTTTDLESVTSGTSVFPETVAGFTRLDQYEDADGFRFAYYSDGFFSFGVFEAPSRVELGEATTLRLGNLSYRRAFTAGQAIYTWETRSRGMALVGDLPPDLHEPVLGELPPPSDPGLFRRIWRSLFG